MIEGVSRFDPERTQQIWATAVDFVFLERDEFIRRRSKRWISRMARIERTSLRNAAFVHRRIATRRFGRDKMKPEVNGALAIKERYPGRLLDARRTEPTSRSPRV
jgi:DNA-directed RNA polymerase specialized sigma subunit